MNRRPTIQLPRGIRQAWGFGAPAGKPGPKRALTVSGIAAAAVAIADAEGAEALSLGRISERLGVTANALYRYVDSRDDLDVIVHDHALGAPIGIEYAGDWAAACAAWCRALRDRYARHPWLSDMRVRVPFAPNSLTWLEALLDRIEPSGLSERQTLRAAGVLDGYVRAWAGAARDVMRAEGKLTDPAALVTLVGDEHFSARLPHVASLISSGFYHEPESGTDDDFEFGLSSILAGLRQIADAPSER